MCGRYTVLTEDEIIEIREILKKLSLQIVRDEFMEANERIEVKSKVASRTIDTVAEVFPINRSPVIIKNSEGILFESIKWGFKKWSGKGVIINARSETMQIKSTFSKHIEAGRCVIPAGAFFEWDRFENGKTKHFVKDKKGNILFMAGLYREAEDGREFVIITKKSTGSMTQLHDRIPVLLKVEQIDKWLGGSYLPADLEKLDFDVDIFPCEDKKNQTSLFD